MRVIRLVTPVVPLRAWGLTACSASSFTQPETREPTSDRTGHGHDFQDVVSDDGGNQLDTVAMKDGLVTRGVLVDMPLLKGVAGNRW